MNRRIMTIPTKPVLQTDDNYSGRALLGGGDALCDNRGRFSEQAPDRIAMAPLLPAKVIEKSVVGKDVCAFTLAPLEGSFPPARPGAHIDVHLPDGSVRQYSLTRAARPGETTQPTYEIAVLREANGRGGSAAMCDAVRAGDEVRISPPRNNFELEADKPFYLLLAGGIGVTPLLAMARELHARKADFQLHVCARTPDHVAFYDDLRQGALRDRAVFHFSETAPSSRLDLSVLLSAAPDGAQVYACGPQRFLAAVDDITCGWPVGRVRKERFSADPDTTAPEEGGVFSVRLARSAIEIEVPANKSLLEALNDAGVKTESSCREGVCGTCVAPVLSGDILHRDACLYDEEKAANTAIACCVSRGKPGATLVLDL